MASHEKKTWDKNRIVKLSHGNGCQLNKNCFACKIKPDCDCSEKDIQQGNAELIDINLIWENG